MGIQGTLDDMSMVELLQMPVRERKTGILNIRDDSREALLVYRQGVLAYATLGDLAGEDAVYELLGWTRGGFSLDFKESDASPNIKTKIENLIMEGIRRLDEKHKQQDELPAGVHPGMKRFLEDLAAENDFITFAGVTDPSLTKLAVKQESANVPVALKQSIAIQLQLIRELSKHVEEDPLDTFITQSRSHMVLNHRLASNAYLIVACERSVPLGELLLTVRAGAEKLNEEFKA